MLYQYLRMKSIDMTRPPQLFSRRNSAGVTYFVETVVILQRSHHERHRQPILGSRCGELGSLTL